MINNNKQNKIYNLQLVEYMKIKKNKNKNKNYKIIKNNKMSNNK